MKVLKLIVLQFYWYISIKFGGDLYIPFLGGLLFFLDFLLFKKSEKLGARYLLFSIALIFVGLTMDKIFNFLGVIDWGELFYPMELIGVWLIFPTYYFHFFEKFAAKKWLAFLMGSIFGPFAYYSGGNINKNIVLSLSGQSLGMLSVFWGLFFFISIHLYINKFHHRV